MLTLSPKSDPSRFDVLAEDIAAARRVHGRNLLSPLLAKGWRLEDLEASEDFEVCAAAKAYALRCASNEQAALVGLLITLAAASLILAYGFAAPVLRGAI